MVNMKAAAEHHPSKPWEAEIDVMLTSIGPPADFKIQTCLPVDASGNIVFANHGRPGFKVRFRLYDNTNNGQGSGFTFPQGASATDAVWSILGANGCPSEGAWQVFEQSSLKVEDGGATLVAFNRNPGPTPQGDFRYTLNVTNNGGPPYVSLDPGGSNQNGGSA